jgi:hypothetical protein
MRPAQRPQHLLPGSEVRLQIPGYLGPSLRQICWVHMPLQLVVLGEILVDRCEDVARRLSELEDLRFNHDVCSKK